jgi:glycolate oxidase FAD binding subunit
VDPPAWWPGAPRAAPGETLVRVSFWVSALARVLDAIEAAAAKADVAPAIEGSAGAGVLYVRLRPHGSTGSIAQASASVEAGSPDELEGSRAVAEFVGTLRGAVAGERGAVAVLTAPDAVRDELAGRGGMSGAVPGLALMRAVKDQFDPDHRMAPGRFPEGI